MDLVERLRRWEKLDFIDPVIMGILNVTPDSFSDGGRYNSIDKALLKAEGMLREGADIIDIGGESTRPGAPPVSVDEELDRVIPVIEKLHQNLDAFISIDTQKAVVMREAAQAGASMINDISALSGENSLEVAAQLQLPVCLVHMRGTPQTMQQDPQYEDVVTEVYDFLEQRIKACEVHGLTKEQLFIDPGFGFGKTTAHNLSLLKHLSRFNCLGVHVLVGLSRKSLLQDITHKAVQDRLSGSLALATIALLKGAEILRVHDVAQTRDIIDVVEAVRYAQ